MCTHINEKMLNFAFNGHVMLEKALKKHNLANQAIILSLELGSLQKKSNKCWEKPYGTRKTPENVSTITFLTENALLNSETGNSHPLAQVSKLKTEKSKIFRFSKNS